MAETKVTRIKAKENEARPKKAASERVKQPKEATSKRNDNPIIRGLKAFGGYFKGAWVELRQVRWPTRRATWGLTLAVLIFSAFFVVIILLLDLLFKYLFELILT